MIANAAMELGRALGLPDREIERIRVASLLHDLGKLAIPDEILTKPGELDEPEWRVVAEHPKIGQVVLEQAGALRDAATIVLHHHEWFDGRGYPFGLAGQEIPIGARIVAIADAYEAMVSGRPYRNAITHGQAMAELRRHGGIQFDPELVGLFTDLFGEHMPFPIEASATTPIRTSRSMRAATARSTTTFTPVVVGSSGRPCRARPRRPAPRADLTSGPGAIRRADGPRRVSTAAILGAFVLRRIRVSRVVFRGGRVFDGTGSPPSLGDVAVEAGRIVEVGPGLDGDEAIDVDRPDASCPGSSTATSMS